jgi:transcriptional regulator with XRE-family HTH domain
MDTYSFGEWLKQRRKQLRLTQREVATAVYCSIAMIKKIEADERQPSIELAQALATTLQIPT